MTTTARLDAFKTLVVLLTMMLFAACGAAWAAPIAIPLLNAGFEAGPATNSPPTDWTTTGTAVAAEAIYDGTPLGNWSMATGSGGQAVQTTGHVISADDIYTLSFWSARTGFLTAPQDINAMFFADNGGTLTLLASIPTGIAGDLKEWLPYQADCGSPAAAFVGQQLAVGFRNTSIGWVGVDEVSLVVDQAVLPEPGESLFFEDFDDFTAPAGNFNGGQYQSGLAVVWGGDVPGWAKSGGGVVHAVDHANVYVSGDPPPPPANPRDFAPMFWQDNVITLGSAIVGSNVSGQAYSVDFLAGPAVYQAPDQQTSVTDGLVIDVLRGDNTVLATYTCLPGAWAGNTVLMPYGFEYVGDGSGDVRFRIGPLSPSGHFGGTIDNLSLTPEPSSLALVVSALVGLALLGRRRRRA